jgi:hypothetical protein
MQEALSRFALDQARAALGRGEWAAALEWLESVPAAVHPREIVAEAHAALAKEAVAGGFWGTAERHLERSLAARREPLLERRLHLVRHTAPPLDDYQWRVLREAVDPAQKLSRQMLAPEVAEIYTCGQYRAWNDRYQPWSRFLRLAKDAPPGDEDGEAVLRLAGEFLCRVVSDETPLLRHVDVVVAVPANPSRYVRRMMSLPDELAKALEAHFALPFLFRALTSQAADDLEIHKLSWRERKEAIRGSMRAGALGIAMNRSILLVDDITTSGATLREAARLLREAGAREVYAITLSHTEG